MFHNPSRGKRQAAMYEPYTGPTAEDFNYTDTQRAICNNTLSCMYDLAITESEEIANITREFTENTTSLQQVNSKCMKLFIARMT